MSKVNGYDSETSASEEDDDKNKRSTANAICVKMNPTTNPYYGNRMHLRCRTKNFLAIHPDGSVKGIMEKTDYTKLELIATGFGGQLMIKGCNSNMLLAMDVEGSIYATQDNEDENTIFYQGVNGDYQTYKSKKFDPKGWYLAIKKSGELKNGKMTAADQKSVHYLSIRF